MLTMLANLSRMSTSGYRNGLAEGISRQACVWDTNWWERRGAWYHKAGYRELLRETRGRTWRVFLNFGQTTKPETASHRRIDSQRLQAARSVLTAVGIRRASYGI
jgi:hypothetical protein